jgi:prepilin-type N-terminal cleavage/methylation domain-containing protein
MRVSETHERRGNKRGEGFTLVEVVVVLAIVAAIIAIAVPFMARSRVNQELKDAARDYAGALNQARAEAIRTGHVFLVFADKDAQGNTLLDSNGNTVAVLVLDDGAPGAPNQNCKIDSGEPRWGVPPVPNIALGLATPVPSAPSDQGLGARSTGSTFTEPLPGGAAATYVMFQTNGMPLAFESGCTTGAAGTGAGAFYLENGERTYSVVLKPMGGARVHGFDLSTNQWTN